MAEEKILPVQIEPYKPKSLMLRKMPEDVYSYAIELQTDAKRKCKCQKSLETVIFSAIRKAGKELEQQNKAMQSANV